MQRLDDLVNSITVALTNPMMSCSCCSLQSKAALAKAPVCELRLNMYFYIVFIHYKETWTGIRFCLLN